MIRHAGVRLAFAWVLIWPALVLYYLAGILLLMMLCVCGGVFRLLLGPAPPISNCVLWAGWRWLAASWHDRRHGVSDCGWPGGYLVVRWSIWGRFLHLGWAPAPLDLLAFVPPEHTRRRLPPPLFAGQVERGP